MLDSKFQQFITVDAHSLSLSKMLYDTTERNK